MFRYRLCVKIVSIFVLSVHGAIAQQPEPPIAEIRSTELTLHDHTRIDNYYWMRNRDDQAVIDYLQAENKYLESTMAKVKVPEETLYQELIARIKPDDTTVPFSDRGYLYYQRTEGGREYPIFCRRSDQTDSEEQVILDVNQFAEGHAFCSVSTIGINQRGDQIAFAVDTVGRRIYTLRFRDLSSGEFLSDEIPRVTSNFVWAEDGQTIFYTRQHPETLRPFQVFRHAIGSDTSEDVLVYEERDETFNCRVRKSRSREYIFIESTQTQSAEFRYVSAKEPGQDFRVFEPRRSGHEYSVDHIGDSYFILTNDQAQNFRLMKCPAEATVREHWREVIPHRKEVFLERFSLFSDFLVLEERRQGLTHLRIVPFSGEPEHELDFGEPAYMATAKPIPDADTSILRYHYTSLTTPLSVIDYDMKTRVRTLRKQQPVEGGFDSTNYVTERLAATARDGARIPISVLYRKGLHRGGKHPCLLYAYGSYGNSMDARFRHDLLSLVDRGFVYAIAHIRGGQELGRPWYEDGKLLQKKNTFTDFIDCGEFLIEEQLADPDRLFAMGGSAGGLLMGAVVNMRPDLFNGVIAAVPFVDIVTTMLDDSIPLTTVEYDEWGNPHDPKYYEYMLSYSPYDNVGAVNYPHMLVTSSLHDSQVQYWEPTKWVAKLRAMKASDNLLLLKTNMDAGHSGASGRFERFREYALMYAFLLHLAGITE